MEIVPRAGTKRDKAGLDERVLIVPPSKIGGVSAEKMLLRAGIVGGKVVRMGGIVPRGVLPKVRTMPQPSERKGAGEPKRGLTEQEIVLVEKMEQAQSALAEGTEETKGTKPDILEIAAEKPGKRKRRGRKGRRKVQPEEIACGEV